MTVPPSDTAPLASPDEVERDAAEQDAATALVARGGVINALGNVIGVLDPLFLVVVSRTLGAGILGSFVLATTYVVMLQRLGVVGLDSGLLRYVPLAAQGDDPAATLRSVLATALRLTLALSLVGTLAIVLLADVIVAAGGDDAAGDGAWWLGWLALALPGRALSQLVLFALRGRNNMAAYVLVNNVVIPGLLLALAVPLIFAGVGKSALVVGYLASAYLGLGVSLWLFRRTFADALGRGSAGSKRASFWRAPHHRGLVSFSLPQGLTDFLNFLLARADIVMIAAFFPDDPALVAIYAIASMLAGVVKKVRQAFDTSLAPVLADLIGRGDQAAMQALYARVTRWIYTLYLLVFGAITFAAPLALRTVGDRYDDYWLVVPILAFGRWLNTAGGPAQMALLMAGRSRLEFLNNLAINVANLALNYVLIGQYGVYGAAVATATSLTFFNAARIVEVRWLIGIGPNVREGARVTLAGILAAVPSVALAFVGLDRLVWAGLATGCFVVLYPAMLYALGLRDDVRAAWAAVRAGYQTWRARRAAASDSSL